MRHYHPPRLVDQNRELALFRMNDDRPSYPKLVAEPRHNVQGYTRFTLSQVVDVNGDGYVFGEPLLQKPPGDPLELGDLILGVRPRQVQAFF